MLEKSSLVQHCCYCGRSFLEVISNIKLKKKEIVPLFTFDHLVPRSKGGINAQFNKLKCCYFCNQEKGDKNIIEYIEVLLLKYANCKGKLKIDVFLKINNCLSIKKYVDEQGFKLYRMFKIKVLNKASIKHQNKNRRSLKFYADYLEMNSNFLKNNLVYLKENNFL